MDKENTSFQTEKQNQEQEPESLSETWAQDALAELDDFIESQGIYIRQ
ncbi:MAG: hypothetical protein Q4E89_06940 [Eubacteriales bacterium]|nr:hypothetical protein [Eubacteriales bacterium]